MQIYGIYNLHNSVLIRAGITTDQDSEWILNEGKEKRKNMRLVTDQRKGARWLAALALCLAVGLTMSPVGLSVVKAQEDGQEENISNVDAFWNAVDAYGYASGEYGDDSVERSGYWGACHSKDDAMANYDSANENGGELGDVRAAVRDSMTALESAYQELANKYDVVKEAYNQLTDMEKSTKGGDDAVSPQDSMNLIKEDFEGDGTEENPGAQTIYQDARVEFKQWNYSDLDAQYWDACRVYDDATTVCWGDEEQNIPGIMSAYEEDKEANRAAALEAVGALEEAYARVEESYEAVKSAYGELSDAEKTEDITSNYSGVESDKQSRDTSFLEMSLNTWKYYDSNDVFWNKETAFWTAMDNFLGNEEQGITGAYTVYMDALESGAAGLDALYAKALETHTAAATAYEEAAKSYQTESAAYAALTAEEQQEIADDENNLTFAGIHGDVVTANAAIEQAHSEFSALEIPQPPTATPTPAPTATPMPTATPAPHATPTPTPSATPAPAAPSGQESAAQSVSGQEPLADWNVVYKDVESSVVSGKTQNVYAQVGDKFQVAGNILDKLAGSETALFLNTGKGLSFSVSGVDVPKGIPSIGVVMAAADGIPETVKQNALVGAAFSRAFAMEDKSAYPVKIDIHLNVGRENAGKNAYLYYYDEISGSLKLAGTFKTTEAGQAMFAIFKGDEYIVVVADKATAQPGSYTVKQGDSLSRIAVKNGISLQQLLKANPGIKNPNKIRPGDVIYFN